MSVIKVLLNANLNRHIESVFTIQYIKRRSHLNVLFVIKVFLKNEIWKVFQFGGHKV